MNKVAVTYWDNSHTISMPVKTRAAKSAQARPNAAPQWLTFAVISSITFMLCLAINIRAFSEMSVEAEQHAHLGLAMEQLTNENFGLQSEVHNLKTDSHTLEREARRIGMSRPNEKVLVPVN